MTQQHCLHSLPVELRILIAAFVMALDDAAELGLLAVVQLLLRQNPGHGSLRTSVGQAVIKAARSGHLQVVQCLYPHCITSHRAYAIEIAASKGHLSVVQFLHTCLPSDGRRTRPIDGAAANGHLKVIVFLLEAGGDAFTVTAIDRAAENGHEEVIDLLLQYEDKALGSREPHGRAFTTLAIRWASRNHHTRIAKRLKDAMTQGHLGITY